MSLCSVLLLIAGIATQTRVTPVTWSMVTVPSAMKPGTSFTLRITGKIGQGWHVYAMTVPAGGPEPTRIWLPEGQPFRTSGSVKGPSTALTLDPSFGSELPFYEGSAIFSVPVRIAADVPPGRRTVRAHVSYQACSETVCLPVSTAKLEATVNIAR